MNVTLKDLRRNQRVYQGQIHNLIEERADYLMQVQDQQREIMTLRQRLGIVQCENEDLATKYSVSIRKLSIFFLNFRIKYILKILNEIIIFLLHGKMLKP